VAAVGKGKPKGKQLAKTSSGATAAETAIAAQAKLKALKKVPRKKG
jgi:hypothetical protein